MKTEEKIEYMIQTLQIALDELKYRQVFKRADETREYKPLEYYEKLRIPNLTLIHENLKTVGRYTYIVEKEIPTIYDNKGENK